MSERTHWPAVLAALAAGIVSGAAVGKMPPALPFLKTEFAMSLIATGWLVSMFNTVSVTAAIFFGLACDRIGALRFCLSGLLCLVAGGVLGAVSTETAWIIISRLLEGLGFVSIVVAAPALIAAATAPGQRGLVLGMWGTYMPIGGTIAVAASPVLLASFGWRGVWVLFAVAGAALAALLAAQSRRYAGVRSGTPRSLASIRASLAQPAPWLLGAAFGMCTLQFFAVMIWLPIYLLETRSIDATTSSLLTALYIFVNFLGNFCGGWLMHWNFARGRVIGISFALASIIFVGIFSSALPDGARYACVLAYGLVSGTIPAAAISCSGRYARSPAEAGGIQGLIVQLSNFGTFIGAPIIATVVTYAGDWDAALWVLLGAGAIGMALAWGVLRDERAHGYA